jgi:hypothetical protein
MVTIIFFVSCLCLKILFVGQAGGLRVGKTQGEPAYEPSPNKQRAIIKISGEVSTAENP